MSLPSTHCVEVLPIIAVVGVQWAHVKWWNTERLHCIERGHTERERIREPRKSADCYFVGCGCLLFSSGGGKFPRASDCKPAGRSVWHCVRQRAEPWAPRRPISRSNNILYNINSSRTSSTAFQPSTPFFWFWMALSKTFTGIICRAGEPIPSPPSEEHSDTPRWSGRKCSDWYYNHINTPPVGLPLFLDDSWHTTCGVTDKGPAKTVIHTW